MICDPFSSFETTIYTKKLDGKPLTPWSTLLPSWTTTCPTFSTKRKSPPCLKLCFPPFCLSSTRNCPFSIALSWFWLCALCFELRRDSPIKIRKLFDSCKVKGQTSVDHIKWACQIYRLTHLCSFQKTWKSFFLKVFASSINIKNGKKKFHME